MRFTIPERYALLDLFPQQSNIVILKLLRDFRHEVELSEMEVLEASVQAVGNSVRWDPVAVQRDDMIKDIPLSDAVTTIFHEILKDLNERKQLRWQHVSLYEKIVEGRTNAEPSTD